MTTPPSTPTRTPVLIVGAGPTGLMLALQLARMGVAFRLVDGKAGPTRESRALGVQARTLELYEALGLAQAAVAQGHPTTALNLHAGPRAAERVPLGQMGQGLSPYPYLLVLEQSRTEALLLEALEAAGGRVEWNTALAAVTPSDLSTAATLKHADGREEAVEADWLVACDGARSAVRERLALPFAGGTYEHLFYVADTHVDWELPHGELRIALSRETFALFFPMAEPAEPPPGAARRYRVIGILPAGGAPAGELRFEDIEAAVRAQMDVAVHFSDTGWFSAYRVHHRCVERFRVGRCLLAGDAAHVHSPVGAQGMNTGLQDACNLAWKLALVVQGQAGPALLDTYHDERWPIAQHLLKTTDRAFRFIVSRRPLARAARLALFPRLLRRLVAVAPARERLFKRISQIGIHYRKSRLSRHAAPGLAARAGDRIPFARLRPPATERPMSVYGALDPARFHVLLLQRQAGGLEPVADAWQRELDALWPGWFRVAALPPSAGAQGLHDAFGIGSGPLERALVLVRPDQYIGYADERVDLHALKNYLIDVIGLRPPLPGERPTGETP